MMRQQQHPTPICLAAYSAHPRLGSNSAPAATALAQQSIQHARQPCLQCFTTVRSQACRGYVQALRRQRMTRAQLGERARADHRACTDNPKPPISVRQANCEHSAREHLLTKASRQRRSAAHQRQLLHASSSTATALMAAPFLGLRWATQARQRLFRPA